jgi:hypothetical protein
MSMNPTMSMNPIHTAFNCCVNCCECLGRECLTETGSAKERYFRVVEPWGKTLRQGGPQKLVRRHLRGLAQDF